MTTIHGRNRGSILVVVLLLMVMGAAFCVTSLLLSQTDSRHADFTAHRLQSLYAAQAGLEDVVRQLRDVRAVVRLDAPFTWYDGLAGQTLASGVWLTKDGVSIGQYDAVVNTVTVVDPYTRDIGVTCTGYVAAKGSATTVTRVISAVVRMSMGRSEVFDYVYFINNWGWYFGDTIIANGNVRANGQFDGGGYRATINAIPRFKMLVSGNLSGYRDDGGVYSGWNIVNVASEQGDVNALWTAADCNTGHCTPAQVGTNKGQHAYQDPITMPNLTDLTLYETLARSSGSYIKIGSTTYVNAVLGDNASEKQNLYLVGTTSAPIVIHGPVVVRGSVVISGVVSGQGCIYSGGNVYIPKNLTYLNAPATVPTSPTETDMESWISANGSKDALGLFARKHIVIGDYTNSSWQSDVSSWVNDSRNESKEDAGSDGIPNTRAGRDGITGTSDDDTLENDGVWTTDHYTAWHQAQGLLPSGKSVGDAIPGSGEDIDGDGVCTPRCAMSEFNIPASLTTTSWAGNVPTGTPSYSSVSTTSITKIESALYTNHHIAALTTASGSDLNINGCVVSRNESIVYGTSHFVLNYDYRLLDPGQSYGIFLPRVWNPVSIVYWNAQ